MTTIHIQPKELPNGTLPYPYFIKKDGKVGRQDFWKGNPSHLIGFSSLPKSGNVDLVFQDFWSSPEKAVGMYPVFADKDNEWVTKTDPIQSVEKIT